MSPPLLKQMGEPHAASSENGPCSGALDGTNEKAKKRKTRKGAGGEGWGKCSHERSEAESAQ